MAVRFQEGSALRSISLTPLIDVVFLLLIFFLVTARFEKQDRELEVTLPSAETAEPMVIEAKELFINIDRRGNYFVLRQRVTIGEVQRTLRQRVADNPGQSVVIRADRLVHWDAVVAAMDACNKAGVAEYTTTTADPE